MLDTGPEVEERTATDSVQVAGTTSGTEPAAGGADIRLGAEAVADTGPVATGSVQMSVPSVSFSYPGVNRLFINSVNAGIRARVATISVKWVGIDAGIGGIPGAGATGGTAGYTAGESIWVAAAGGTVGGGTGNGATDTAGAGAGYTVGTGGTGAASAGYTVGPGGGGAGYAAGSASGGIEFATGGTVCTIWVGTSNEAIGV
ncbi:PE-PGRS family protein PE_PGRS26-like [Zingiber officinale]|uniref:PE-PGRS family protein PE_PGRS26-like n=1 Tax=Zingiber officinale TaxID=94328 RepID=UPI001C4C426F|nr:PE-PGRS family protein PE_PGRS26-like [Zingiber officinale]